MGQLELPKLPMEDPTETTYSSASLLPSSPGADLKNIPVKCPTSKSLPQNLLPREPRASKIQNLNSYKGKRIFFSFEGGGELCYVTKGSFTPPKNYLNPS